MTVLWNVGQRIDASRGYFKHEAAATTSRMTKGKPLDAGAAMRMSSNLAHLCYESCRNLVQSPGVGASKVAAFSGTATLFGNVADAAYANADVSTGAIDGVAALPWDPRVCEYFPAIVIADRQNSIGRTTLRSVRFTLDFTADATNSSTSVGFAITTHSSPAQLRGGDYLAFYGSAALGTGSQIVTHTLSCDRPIDASYFRRTTSRAASTGFSDVGVIPIYLWFGWKFIGAGTANTINGFGAWESRIDPA